MGNGATASNCVPAKSQQHRRSPEQPELVGERGQHVDVLVWGGVLGQGRAPRGVRTSRLAPGLGAMAARASSMAKSALSSRSSMTPTTHSCTSGPDIVLNTSAAGSEQCMICKLLAAGSEQWTRRPAADCDQDTGKDHQAPAT